MPPSQNPQLLQIYQGDSAAIQAEIRAGLMRPDAEVAPKYLYDALGSRLFEAITELSEYYPTRTEAAILRQCASELAAALPQGAVLIDLGAGNCAKAERLFATLNPCAYLALDISVDFLRDSLAQLQQRHPSLPLLGLGLDFSSALTLPTDAEAWLQRAGLADRPRVVFYPGSSIGNFSPADALRLLQQASDLCSPMGGGLLIGVDQTKASELLEPAYADALGVTAAFNRNLLLNVNRWLKSDFLPAHWAHVALFNAVQSRVEMHLQARQALSVRWPGGGRDFLAGERIHTENAYKWRAAEFAQLLATAGFCRSRRWHDPQDWFGVHWAEVVAR